MVIIPATPPYSSITITGNGLVPPREWPTDKVIVHAELLRKIKTRRLAGAQVEVYLRTVVDGKRRGRRKKPEPRLPIVLGKKRHAVVGLSGEGL